MSSSHLFLLQIGEICITSLLAECKRVLGCDDSTFPYPAFHDAILDHGTVPLAMMEENVRAWLSTAVREKGTNQSST